MSKKLQSHLFEGCYKWSVENQRQFMTLVLRADQLAEVVLDWLAMDDDVVFFNVVGPAVKSIEAHDDHLAVVIQEMGVDREFSIPLTAIDHCILDTGNSFEKNVGEGLPMMFPDIEAYAAAAVRLRGINSEIRTGTKIERARPKLSLVQ